MVILSEAPVLICRSMWDKLVQASLLARYDIRPTVLILLKIELAESTTALEPDAPAEHHTHRCVIARL